MTLDDVVAVPVDHGEFRVRKLLLREDPFLLKFRDWKNAQKDGAPKSVGIGIVKCDRVAERDGLFPVDGVRVRARDVDGATDLVDPADVGKKLQPLVRDGVIVGRVLPRFRGQTGQRVGENDVRGGVRQHVGDPDEGDRLVDRHILAVDIARPDVADTLLALQIVLCHVLHRDRGVLEVLDLNLRRFAVLDVGVDDHEDQHCDHNEYVDDNDPSSFHTVFRFLVIPLHANQRFFELWV